LVTIRIFFFSQFATTSSHHIPRSSSLTATSSRRSFLESFNSRPVLINCLFFAFNFVQLEAATCRRFFLSKTAPCRVLFSGSTERASILSAQHLYQRCRHTISITGFYHVIQRDGYPEGAAAAQL
jgi:hypothetical protein